MPGDAAGGTKGAAADGAAHGPDADSPAIKADSGATSGSDGIAPAREEAGDAVAVCTANSRPNDDDAGGVEKKEPTLRVPSGAGTAAASSGRDSSAARKAGRNPAVVEPDVAALDMAAARSGAAAVKTAAASSGPVHRFRLRCVPRQPGIVIKMG